MLSAAVVKLLCCEFMTVDFWNNGTERRELKYARFLCR